MGLFDPPYKNILAKIHGPLKEEAVALEALIERRFADADYNQRSFMKAVLLSIWATNAHSQTLISLSHFDAGLFRNYATGAFKKLSELNKNRVSELMVDLNAQGLLYSSDESG